MYCDLEQLLLCWTMPHAEPERETWSARNQVQVCCRQHPLCSLYRKTWWSGLELVQAPLCMERQGHLYLRFRQRLEVSWACGMGAPAQLRTSQYTDVTGVGEQEWEDTCLRLSKSLGGPRAMVKKTDLISEHTLHVDQSPMQRHCFEP